jgi:hypothetical protein
VPIFPEPMSAALIFAMGRVYSGPARRDLL